MTISLWPDAQRFLVEATDLGEDALHISIGLAVLLAAAVALRRPLADWRPLAAVVVAAVAGELWDLLDTFMHGGRPRWSGNGKDIWNTLFWPAVLFLLARFTRVLKR